MTTYCAPCIADLGLVREATTAVSGTASCMAHAVLLSHPGDSPQRRLTRLGELRALAEGKLATASAEDAPTLELLVQEYALAGAMDMTVPLRDLAGDRAPRPPKSRRNRPGRGERGEGREGRGEQRGDRGPRPEQPAGEGAPVETTGTAPAETAPVESAPVETVPAPSAPVETAPVESAPAPSTPAETAPATAPAAVGEGPTAPSAPEPSAE